MSQDRQLKLFICGNDKRADQYYMRRNKRIIFQSIVYPDVPRA